MKRKLDLLLPFHKVDDYFYQAIHSIQESSIQPHVILIDDRPTSEKTRFSNFGFNKFSILKTGGEAGYGLALELGSKFIETEHVALFNSDDLIHPKKFEIQLSNIRESDISITNLQRINDKNRPIHSLLGTLNTDTYDPIFLILGAYGANATWLMKSEWWLNNAFFDNQEMLDWRIALKTFNDARITYSNEKLYLYRKHNSQKTKQRKYAQEDLMPIYESMNIFIQKVGLPKINFATFIDVSLPWVQGISTLNSSISTWSAEVTKYMNNYDYAIQRNFQDLLARRYIAKSFKSFVNDKKIYYSKNGLRAVSCLGRELFSNFLVDHF